VLRFIACAPACALLLVASAPAAPVPPAPKTPPTYYFPTKVGTKLEYEEPSRQLTMVVTAVADRAGTKVVSVGRVGKDETISPLMTMCVTGGGLYRTERLGQKLDTPETWLQLPAEVDSIWEYPVGNPAISPRPVAKMTVLGTEEVTVPAGSFRCVRVQRIEAGRSSVCWYAPDVGLVKTEAAAWTEVLRSFTPPKD
jgi:hypothetical protein